MFINNHPQRNLNVVLSHFYVVIFISYYWNIISILAFMLYFTSKQQNHDNIIKHKVEYSKKKNY